MDFGSSDSLGYPPPSLRCVLEALQAHLLEAAWDAERITLELAQLHCMLELRLSQQARRYANAMAETPWIAPSVRDLLRLGAQLRESLEHLQARWTRRHCCPDLVWREAFQDFALRVVEHEAHESQLRDEAFQLFFNEEPLDPLASG